MGESIHGEHKVRLFIGLLLRSFILILKFLLVELLRSQVVSILVAFEQVIELFSEIRFLLENLNELFGFIDIFELDGGELGFSDLRKISNVGRSSGSAQLN